MSVTPREAVPDEAGPFISILFYNYDGRELARCLDSVLGQTVLANYEIVICDDDSKDGAWHIACRYAKEHSGLISLNRNRQSMGKADNRSKALLMCKGEYCVELSSTDMFDAAYIRDSIWGMEADKYLAHAFITRLQRANIFMPTYNPVRVEPVDERAYNPLVSVLVYNYNYGRYLRQCLESVFSQTYGNIEVCFSDNASTDDSWEIALEFAERYPERMCLTLNRMNYGPNINLWNCVLNMRGKYMLKLCSDDAMRPEFIKRCVEALERNPEAAFAMVHRDIMDDEGVRTQEPPFYEQSCLIPGFEQVAVYMMSSVNPSISQILYSVDKTQGKRMAGNLNDRWFGDRIMDFHICCDYPIVYIKDALLLNRVHGHSEGAQMDGNLLQCMGEFVLLHQLADIAGNYPGLDKARGRLQPAVEKIGRLCLRYCLRCLAAADEQCARRYYHLAVAIFPTIEDDEVYSELSRYWGLAGGEREDFLGRLMARLPNVVKRVVSYPVPPGSVPC